jgi:hypothetical protein
MPPTCTPLRSHAPRDDAPLGEQLDAVLNDVLPRLLGASAARPGTQDATFVTPWTLRAAAGALGRAAARDGLTPDALLARLEDGVSAAVAAGPQVALTGGGRRRGARPVGWGARRVPRHPRRDGRGGSPRRDTARCSAPGRVTAVLVGAAWAVLAVGFGYAAHRAVSDTRP